MTPPPDTRMADEIGHLHAHMVKGAVFDARGNSRYLDGVTDAYRAAMSVVGQTMTEDEAEAALDGYECPFAGDDDEPCRLAELIEEH